MNKKGQDSEPLENEVLDLIEKYLSEEKDVKSYDEQIAVVVYYLLGGRQFDDFIEYYPAASASVLRAFASSDVAEKLKQEVGTFNFDTLCKMLERMVEFCWDIKGNQMFLAHLDQLMFGTSVRAWPDSYIIHYKNKYERLLKNSSED